MSRRRRRGETTEHRNLTRAAGFSRKPQAHVWGIADRIDDPIGRIALTRHCEDCPDCGGIVTDEDMQYVQDETGRHVAMLCPHCGRRDSKLLMSDKAPAK